MAACRGIKVLMMMSECPYCKLIVKVGGLYCRKHQTLDDFLKLGSGIHIIRSNQIDMPDQHTTRLSMNFDFTGSIGYEFNNKSFSVKPNSFVLMDHGTSYRSILNDKTSHTTASIVFRYGLAEEVFDTIKRSNIDMLDYPMIREGQNLSFIEDIYSWNEERKRKTWELIQYILSGNEPDANYMDEFMEETLVELIESQYNVHQEINTLKFEKWSTKIEIYRRLKGAREFIHDHLPMNITVSDMANEAALSLHHFKRIFKDFYGISPHQYLTKLRIDKAIELLDNSSLTVSEICNQVGFSDPSSFGRLFKSKFLKTPLEFKKELRRAEVFNR